MKTNIITAVLFSIFVANAFVQDSAVVKLSFKAFFQFCLVSFAIVFSIEY